MIRNLPGTENITLITYLFTNIYLVEHENGLIVVDTGMKGNARRIVKAIQNLGHQPQDLSHIILTHAHFDHFGSAAALQKMTGAPIAAHSADADAFAAGGVGVLPGPWGRWLNKVFFLKAGFLGAPGVNVDLPLKNGDRIGEWEVLHTPGHTAGTISLFSGKRQVLITGGWAVTSGIPRPQSRAPLTKLFSASPRAVQTSRRRLSLLSFRTVLCSHFPPRLFPLFAYQLRSLALTPTS